MKNIIKLENISEVTRVSVNEYAARLHLPDGTTLPVGFRRVLSGWDTELNISVDGRGFHTLDNSPETRAFWGQLDGKACNEEARLEQVRQARRLSVVEALLAR
jgi:hypothetical protein